MPLEKGSSGKVIGRNIKKEIKSSKPKKQAVAIAMKQAGKSNRDIKRRIGDQMTFDGFDNFVSRLGMNNDNTLSAGIYTFNLITRNRIELEAAYRGSWVVGQVIDCVSEDMTKAGVDISTTEDEAGIKKIKSAISKLKIHRSLCDTIRWGRLYGGSISLLQIEGQDLSTPLDISTIDKDQFKGLVVFDRWQLNPQMTELIGEGPDMGLPSYYQIVNDPRTAADPKALSATGYERVHHSRIIRNIGIQLPYYQAITEMMWGESILERLWDRLISFDSATMSTANLIERANNRTVGIDKLREIIAAGGKAQQGLEAMFDMMRVFQTNEGLTLLDKEDTFQTTSYSFAGLSEVMLQFGQQLSGASGIPLVRLFGQSPAGLNATGESDLRTYYDNINSQQESRLRPGWDLLLKVLWPSVLGKSAPEDLEFDFTALWQTSLMDKSTIAKTTAETVSGAYEAGLVSRSTAMKELRQASGDNGLFSNISDEEIAEAEEEAENPPMPGGSVPGAENPENAEGKGLPTPAPSEEKLKDASMMNKIKVWVGM